MALIRSILYILSISILFLSISFDGAYANEGVYDLLVNENNIRDNQFKPKVAISEFGDFVVVWATEVPASTNLAILARIYHASGIPKGPEIIIANDNSQDYSVAIDARGNFVVAWGLAL